ncbi:hypothetical protein HUJ04_002556 [Dendroctonus ponderosae]|nr:hypothetical protein HUJ04_002556 [Dendroctonus ponderosae]
MCEKISSIFNQSNTPIEVSVHIQSMTALSSNRKGTSIKPLNRNMLTMLHHWEKNKEPYMKQNNLRELKYQLSQDVSSQVNSAIDYNQSELQDQHEQKHGWDAVLFQVFTPALRIPEYGRNDQPQHFQQLVPAQSHRLILEMLHHRAPLHPMRHFSFYWSSWSWILCSKQIFVVNQPKMPFAIYLAES